MLALLIAGNQVDEVLKVLEQQVNEPEFTKLLESKKNQR